MSINDLIGVAVSGGDLPHHNDPVRSGLNVFVAPPASLRAIVDAIASRRGVTLYRESAE